MTLPTLLAHVAARWAVTRTPAHGWVPDESETEMTVNLRTETLLGIISKGLWVQKETEILAYWDEDPEEVRATYSREAAELMEREGLA